MQRSMQPLRPLVLGAVFGGAVLGAVPVGAQAPITATTPPGVFMAGAGIALPLPPIIVIPPIMSGGELHSGGRAVSGRAEADIDIDRKPGQAAAG